MYKPTSDFYLTAKKIWGTVVKTDTANSNALTLELELHKRLLNIFQAGDYYYLIFNIYQGAIEFVSERMLDVLGYTSNELTALFLMDNIHPDDKSYFLDFEYQITEFFKPLPYDKIKRVPSGLILPICNFTKPARTELNISTIKNISLR